MTNMVVKERDGKSGGLVLFWKSVVDVSLLGVHKRYINVEIKEVDGTL